MFFILSVEKGKKDTAAVTCLFPPSPLRPNVPGSSQQNVFRCCGSTRAHWAHRPPHSRLAGPHRRGSHVNAHLPFIKWALPGARPHHGTPLYLRSCWVHVLVLGWRQRRFPSTGGWSPITTGTYSKEERKRLSACVFKSKTNYKHELFWTFCTYV